MNWEARDYCRCGKIVFDDKVEAARVARVLNARNRRYVGRQVPVHPYPCTLPDCRVWHVGHDVKAAR